MQSSWRRAERIERLRPPPLIESQTSLSTIKVTLRPPAPLVSTSGFFQGIGRAFGDGVDIAASITLGLIRVILALIPILLLVVLPLALLLRFLLRRMRRQRPPSEAVPTQSSPRLRPRAPTRPRDGRTRRGRVSA